MAGMVAPKVWTGGSKSPVIIANNGTMLFKLTNIVLGVSLHMFGAISAFVLLQRFVNRFIPENNVIDFFETQHGYLSDTPAAYLFRCWFNGIVTPVVLVIINFVFSLVVSTLLSVLMHKTKVTRFLVGNK